jgi:threonine synthase
MAPRITYISTNASVAVQTAPVSFREALFMGLAPDGGLFMPTTLPQFTPAELAALRGASYADVAFHVLRPFLCDALDDATLRGIMHDAYNFHVPIDNIAHDTWLLRLDQGPTASFKDFAARCMARVMQALKPAGNTLTILVATSGDTGSAVGEAFHGLAGIRVIILYPQCEVSPMQKQQLDCIGGNVQAVALDGTFDDCQALVKRAFLDPDLAALQLSSANSINIGRILPQSVYYFYAWLQVAHKHEPVLFSIPSGNFGNSFGCELARRMGLPVARIILAVNANDEFPRLLQTGNYQPVVPSRACLSNAMNVGNPSNLARYFALYGGVLDKAGTVVRMPDLAAMRANLFSVAISDDETLQTMRDVYHRDAVLLEPHTAVGVAALRRYYEQQPRRRAVCLATAHPAKYADLIRQELSVDAPYHPGLHAPAARTGAAVAMPNDYHAVKEFLLRHEK